MGLEAVMAVLGPTVTTAINEAGPVLNQSGNVVTGKVTEGWPLGSVLTELLAQAGSRYMVTLYALSGGRDTTKYQPYETALPQPMTTLNATIAGQVVTFAGTPQANLNIWTFTGPNAGFLYQTTSSDTLASIASAVALAAGGTALGASATFASAVSLKVNIGGSVTGAVIAEAGRMTKRIQVSAWSPDPLVRGTLRDRIIGGVATADRRYLTLADGSYADINYMTDSDNDTSQNSYSLYEAHIVFEVDYPITRIATVTQIGNEQAAITAGTVSHTLIGG